MYYHFFLLLASSKLSRTPKIITLAPRGKSGWLDGRKRLEMLVSALPSLLRTLDQTFDVGFAFVLAAPLLSDSVGLGRSKLVSVVWHNVHRTAAHVYVYI